jgi:hypothetical protein
VTVVQGDALRSWAAGLAPRWQGPVLGAIAARDRFDAVVARVAPGPTQDRLRDLRPTIDAAVQHVADATYRAAQAESLAEVLDARTAADELKAARRDLDALTRGGADTAEAEARVEALAERHRAVNRALNLAEDAASGIERWTLRLDTAVANAATVALRASEPSAVDDLDRELRDVVDGLTALDRAFDDLPR